MWQINNWKGRFKINYHTLKKLNSSGEKECVCVCEREERGRWKAKVFLLIYTTILLRWLHWLEPFAFHLNYSIQYNNRQNKITFFRSVGDVFVIVVHYIYIFWLHMSAKSLNDDKSHNGTTTRQNNYRHSQIQRGRAKKRAPLSNAQQTLS